MVENGFLDRIVGILIFIIIIFSAIIIFSDSVESRLIINGKVYSDVGSSSINASNVLNPFWLNISDQRYNDTTFISNVLLNYYNQSEVDSLIAGVNVTTYINLSNNITNNNNFYINTTNNFTTTYNDSALLQSFSDLNSSVLHNSGSQVLNGNLTINGEFFVVGQIINLTVVDLFMNGSMIPQISGLFDLGGSSNVWNNLYVNNIYSSNICYSNGTGCIAVANGTNGLDGVNGTNGLNGINGTNGLNGTNGINGTNGYTPIYGVDYINGTNGIDGVNGTNGIDGLNGSWDGLADNCSVGYFSSFNGTSFICVFDNDTMYALNSSLANYLLIDDQRYNDTILIQNINISLIAVVDTKLNISDQRYNDTSLIVGINSSLSATIIDVNNSLFSRISAVNNSALHNVGNQSLNGSLSIFGNRLDINGGWLTPFGTSFINGDMWTDGSIFLTGNITSVTVNQISLNGSWFPALDNIFLLGNVSHRWSAIYGVNIFATNLYGLLNASYIQNPYWLNVSDQRFNDTGLINSLNVTLNNNIIVYGGIYSTTTDSLTLTTQNVWYNFSNWTLGDSYGCSLGLNNDSLMCGSAGVYRISYVVNDAINSADELNYHLLINGVVENKSFIQQAYTSGKSQSAINYFHERLNVNDTIKLQVLNTGTNGKVLGVYNKNIIVERLGN